MRIYQLHTPVIATGGNRYCGPGAISLLTGISTGAAALWLRVVSGQKAIMRVAPCYMVSVLMHAGTVTPQPKPLREMRWPVSLSTFVAGLPDGRYLIHVTGHYVAATVNGTERRIADNRSVYAYTPDTFKRGGMRVREAWRIG